MLRDPQLEPQRIDRVVHAHGGAVEADALAPQVELDQPEQRRVERGRIPRRGLLCQLLGPERLEAHDPHELRWTCARVEMLPDLDQLPDTPMELRDDDGQRRAAIGQACREHRGLGTAPGGDGIEERPDRAWDGLRHQLLDVVAGHVAARSIERQLLELAVGELRLSPPIDIPLPYMGADALREQLRGAWPEADAQLRGSATEPGLHARTIERRELPDAAARSLDRITQHALPGGVLGILGDEVRDAQRVAGCHEVEQREGPLAARGLPQQGARLAQHDERAVTEQGRGPQSGSDLVEESCPALGDGAGSGVVGVVVE